MKIDYIYIINLQTDNDKIVNKLNNVNWPYNINYEILSATNGWDVVNGKSQANFKFKPADWWKLEDSDINWYNRPVTPGEIGCMLSHYECIYKGYHAGHENILIFEEDFYKSKKDITEEVLNDIPKDASLIYLDRKKVNKDEKEIRINDNVTKVGYTYNNHAYIVTRKGMKEVIDSAILDNIIISDEFFPAINGTSNRKDAIKIFHNPKFKAYALNGGYFEQSSNADSTSLTEFPPEIVNKNKLKQIGILDDSDWERWSKKYINPLILNKEYDLAIDEPAPHVYVFPFFTKVFCKELIELSEQFDWTTDRHEFYPTTDNLLEVLGLDKIYNRIINDYVKPLAINRFGLEGKSWDYLRDESFIIKYPYDQQAHLSLHHDHSSITTLVNLNPGEFKGGGTYFPKYKCNVNPKEIGVMTLHPGNITHKHGARPVTEGTRYVVVSFIKNSDHV
jgi:GR25 family glycosyltransferase involved in LPS biosynthesis